MCVGVCECIRMGYGYGGAMRFPGICVYFYIFRRGCPAGCSPTPDCYGVRERRRRVRGYMKERERGGKSGAE